MPDIFGLPQGYLLVYFQFAIARQCLSQILQTFLVMKFAWIKLNAIHTSMQLSAIVAKKLTK